MLEVIVFVAFILSIVALAKARNTADRLRIETASLRADIQALREERPVATVGGNAIAVTATADEAVPAAVVEAAPVAVVSEQPAPVSEEIVIPAHTGEQERVEKASRGEPVPRPAIAASAKVSGSRESLESKLGARWAVWVGGLALALGGVFMVKVSIDAGLLSPVVRLFLAAIFAVALVVAGEVVRRRAVPGIASDFRNAMIPGILTAAGAVTLFGVIFAAHGIYGFIGPVPAFLLLSVVALGTVALSLLHGQALAGLGLLGSLATPLLIASDDANPWTLFGFLSIAWLANLMAARIRHWNTVPSLANAGLGCWVMFYMLAGDEVQTLPVLLTMLLMITAIGLIWPGNAGQSLGEAPEAAAGERGPVAGPWERTFIPPHIAITMTAAFFAIIPALLMVSPLIAFDGNPVIGFAVLVSALALLGALRGYAVYPALLSALAAMAGVLSLTAGGSLALAGSIDPSAPVSDLLVTATTLILAATFAVLGAVAVLHRLERHPVYAATWSLLAALVPSSLIGISFLMTGNFTFDGTHGAAALVLGIALAGLAVFVSQKPVPQENLFLPQGFLVAGSFGAFVLALHAMTDGLATTLMLALLGTAYVAATRFRDWPILPWMKVASAAVVLGRIAWEPTIVGPAALSTTPFFNQLLAGYGIPAILLVACAYELRNWKGARVRNLLQALASLMALLTVAILVRHAMNGGVLDDAVPTLGEQSIYTLLAIGASGILMTLDLRSPSPVFRYGSMAVGVASMLSILSAHLIGLNPYFSGELLGSMPFLDLLLLGYLLPGIAYCGLAWYARGKRPAFYVTALAISGAVLAFAWATLSVRRFWQGPNIADWKGFLEGETYTYSVVWLLLGVLLLALGSKFNAKSIRLVSAALVFIAVLKVFLIDMSNLEGFLRALSFIGLGAVLIGIGLFYQKILSGKSDETDAALPDSEPPEQASETPAHV